MYSREVAIARVEFVESPKMGGGEYVLYEVIEDAQTTTWAVPDHLPLLEVGERVLVRYMIIESLGEIELEVWKIPRESEWQDN